LRKRAGIPPQISRFIGYRPISSTSLHDPLPFPPFKWLRKIPLRYEIWLFATIGAFTSILLIEAIMSTSTVFRDVYHSPNIVTSFGASAVLVISSTYGNGDVPDNAQAFYAAIEAGVAVLAIATTLALPRSALLFARLEDISPAIAWAMGPVDEQSYGCGKSAPVP